MGQFYGVFCGLIEDHHIRSSGRDPLKVELLHGKNAKRDEHRHNEELRNQEWRLLSERES